LYLYPDGTQGRSTITIIVSGQTNIKTVNFGVVSPTPTPTISSDPTASESPKVSATSIPKIKKSTTIKCAKGKLTKKITGINPKCPAGYKKA
jgi:hypothetical protein